MAEENISKNFFSNSHQIKDAENRPLTNIYWSFGPRPGPVYGTVYLIHGYGGSPVEPVMKLPMQAALKHGFDVVAIEGVSLSATAETDKQINDMTLERQKKALGVGLDFCRSLPDINRSYKIGWVHSISCRALSDLVIDSPAIRRYFNELVLNNPYFLPPPKVQALREKLMRRDPSGETWDILTHKVTTQLREIERHTFKIPTCLYNLCIPLPSMWSKKVKFEDLAMCMSFFIKKLRVHFILGTADNMADYKQNMQFYNGLLIPNKQLVSIPGATHAFENALGTYSECTNLILKNIQERRQQQK